MVEILTVYEKEKKTMMLNYSNICTNIISTILLFL